MLLLVRHGQATANAEGRLLGRLDAPLTDLGRDQAGEVARVLDGVTRVISSPLRRCRETAQILAAGLEVEIDERWIELDYGSFEGRALADVTPETWRHWRSDPAYRWPGGETLDEVAARTRAACEELFATEDAGARRRGGHVVVVSHVSPIKAAVAWGLGAPPPLAWRLHLATGSITRLAWGAGHPVLQGFNETPRS